MAVNYSMTNVGNGYNIDNIFVKGNGIHDFIPKLCNYFPLHLFPIACNNATIKSSNTTVSASHALLFSSLSPISSSEKLGVLSSTVSVSPLLLSIVLLWRLKRKRKGFKGILGWRVLWQFFTSELSWLIALLPVFRNAAAFGSSVFG